MVVEDVVLVVELRLEFVGGAAGAGGRLLEHGHRLHDLLEAVLPAGDVEGDGVGQLGVGHVLDAEQLHDLLPDGLQLRDLADAGRVPLAEHQDDDVEELLDQRRDLSVRFLPISINFSNA